MTDAEIEALIARGGMPTGERLTDLAKDMHRSIRIHGESQRAAHIYDIIRSMSPTEWTRLAWALAEPALRVQESLLMSERDAARAAKAELVEALGPFGQAADQYDIGGPDADHEPICTIADLRRARELVQKHGGGK